MQTLDNILAKFGVPPMSKGRFNYLRYQVKVLPPHDGVINKQKVYSDPDKVIQALLRFVAR